MGVILFHSGQAASILQCMWLFLTLFGLLGGAAVCSLGSWEERLFGSLTDIEPSKRSVLRPIFTDYNPSTQVYGSLWDRLKSETRPRAAPSAYCLALWAAAPRDASTGRET